jgi:DNA-binding response OmpR family regulator
LAVASINHLQVLIVDDNLSLAENIAELLRFEGHTAEVAGSAEEAFPKALAIKPDVVVTDYRLPGINGAVFVKQFRAAHLHVRAMVISAHTDEATVEEATGSGATFMAKPLDLRGLERWISAVAAEPRC